MSFTWDPKLPERLVFYNLDGIVLSLLGLLSMQGEVHHVEQEVVLGAGVLDVLLSLLSQPLEGTHSKNCLIQLISISVLFFNQKLI